MTSGSSALDAESARLLRDLRAPAAGPASANRDRAIAQLHALLLHAAHSEARRRGTRLRLSGPQLDDLAHDAAADAVLAILRKLPDFRGDSRFTTWAYKFVILEVSSKITRHVWQRPSTPLDTEHWDKLPSSLGMDPAEHAESLALRDALRRAVQDDLTPHQRQLFVAIVLGGVPLDVLVAQLGMSRNAIYKGLFDARRKIRASLVANGYLGADTARAEPESRSR